MNPPSDLTQRIAAALKPWFTGQLTYVDGNCERAIIAAILDGAPELHVANILSGVGEGESADQLLGVSVDDFTALHTEARIRIEIMKDAMALTVAAHMRDNADSLAQIDALTEERDGVRVQLLAASETRDALIDELNRRAIAINELTESVRAATQLNVRLAHEKAELRDELVVALARIKGHESTEHHLREQLTDLTQP